MVKTTKMIRILLTAAILLLLPWLAMQFTDQVAWDLADFAVAAALLVGAGITYELVARKRQIVAYRVAVGIALAAALLLVWVNLAVGLIGSENNPANLMSLGVLAVGLIGAVIARLEPRGMAGALFATALAQMLVPVIALMLWKPLATSAMLGLFGLNACFALLFVASALLFRRAGRERHEPGVEPTA